MRKAGVLLPVASLHGGYGIGTMGKEARQWIDFLEKSHQSIWQILPLGPTGFGNSPYQSVSAFAGNPFLLDLDLLAREALLKQDEYAHLGSKTGRVEYYMQQREKMQVLRQAAARFFKAPDEEFALFCQEEADWLTAYAAFMTIKGRMDGRALEKWPKPLHSFPQAMKMLEEDEFAQEEMNFWRFLQYEFYLQWDALKAYAHKKNITIFGDVPIYVAADSADLWEHPDLFQLTQEGTLSSVAGCPPDYFSPDGQFWGNPLYDWRAHKKENYAWWTRRISHAMRLYDTVRIDHFRGLAGYWSIPAKDETAAGGHWEKGPGMDLFTSMEQTLGKLPIVAEDLGDITPDVEQLLQDSGFPGMKVLQFAFGSDDTNVYLPHNHIPNCVVYTGTHDNTTLVDWARTEDEKALQRGKTYLGLKTIGELPGALMQAALSSVADTCIIPLQDWLGLGAEGRINTPNTMEENWNYRLNGSELTDALAERIARATELYGRNPRTVHPPQERKLPYQPIVYQGEE